MRLFLLFILAFPFLTQAAELLSSSEYGTLTVSQKIQVIHAYKQFAEDYSKTENVSELEEISFSKPSFGLIEEAIAAEKYDCLYAGWPSVKNFRTVKGKKKSFCSSPAKSNPDYKKTSQKCGAGQLACQPVLFGKDQCVSVKTQGLRSSAYAQCQKKFVASGKSLEKIVEENPASEFEDLAKFASDVCTSGYQASTGMCTSLKYKISQVKGKESKTEGTAVPEASTPPSDTETVSSSDEEASDVKAALVEVVNEGNEEVGKINKSTSAAALIAGDCEEAPEASEVQEVYTGYGSSEPVDQSKETPADYCSGGQKGYLKTRFEASIPKLPVEHINASIVYQGKQSDLKNSVPGGYTIKGYKYGEPKTTLENGKVPEDDRKLIYNDRIFSNSFLGRGKENTFEVSDAPIKEIYSGEKINERYVSTDLKRVQYSFFPRKVVPSIKVKGEELVMKMTTGEEIVVSSRTGKVVSGAAKEVPWKKNVVSEVVKGKKQVRTYIDNEFSYEGNGLYIQSVQHPSVNEKDPGSVVPVRAKVNGELQECKLKSEDVWEHNEGHYLPKSDTDYAASYWTCHKFKFTKDQDLYDLIKKTCKDFKFPALVK